MWCGTKTSLTLRSSGTGQQPASPAAGQLLTSNVRTAMRITISLLTLFLTACATAPSSSHDPDAKETPVRVLQKRVIDQVTRETAEYKPTMVIPVGNIVLIHTKRGDTAWIPIYEYTVADRNKTTATIQSEYSGFEVGQCLKLFTSIQPTYPRLAYGAACEQF